GTGTIKATLNVSKRRTKVASLLKMKQFNGIEIPSKTTITQEMQQVVRKLKATPGISDVHYSIDINNYIAILYIHFDHVPALTDFTKALSAQFKTQITIYNSYRYDATSQTFNRSYTYTPNLAKEFSKIPNDDKNLFADAYYTNIIRFDKNIQSQSH